MQYNETAWPREADGTMSMRVLPPMESGPAPAKPLRNRKVKRTPMFGATAQATLQARNSTFEILYTGYRPYNSDIGAANLEGFGISLLESFRLFTEQ